MLKPFIWYFIEAWLVTNTVFNILEDVSTGFTHMYLGTFTPSSWQIILISVRLDGEYLWTSIFRFLHRCSIGFWIVLVIVVLKGQPSLQAKVICRNELSICGSSLNSDQSPYPYWWEVPQKHDSATTMLHHWDGVRHLIAVPSFCQT